MEVYKYTSGLAKTEQDLVLALDDFLINTIGWTRVEKVTDTTSNRDYTWTSTGEPDWVNAGGDPLFIRVQGTSDYWYLRAYRTYTSSVAYTFELYNATNTRTDLSSDWFDYWFYGNKNFVCCIINDNSINEPVVAYLGLINSYHGIETDDYPMMIKGCAVNSYSWTNTEYCYMYTVVASGSGSHSVLDWWNTIQYDKGLRNASSVLMMPVVVAEDNDYQTDIRGEPYGVYQANGRRLPVYGSLVSASGVFITAKIDSNDQYCNVYGPVASGTEGFNMWQWQKKWIDGTEY